MMRFILREQPYEQLIAAGSLQYELGGRATGVVEHWRQTAAVDGFRFWRLDWDGRAVDGRSWLFHLVVDAAALPQRLQFRYFAPSQMGKGDAQRHDDHWLVGYSQGTRPRQEQHLAAEHLYLPTMAGLALLAPLRGAGELTALGWSDEGVPQLALLQYQEGPREMIPILTQPTLARSLRLVWQNQAQTVWFDRYDCPVQWIKEGGGERGRVQTYIRHQYPVKE